MVVTSENLPTSGYTQNTADSFLLNAGAWVKDLKWDKEESKWSYNLIGATSGGSKITLKNTYRQAEIDGVFTTPVGADSIESSEGTLELNLIEFTLETLKTVLLADSEDSDGDIFPEGYSVIKSRARIKDTDYVKDLAYIGTVSGSNKPIIIILHQAICTSGLEIEPKDKAEAIYTVVYEARTAAGEVNDASLPITILYPDNANADEQSPQATKLAIDGVPTEEKDEKGVKK